MRQPLRMGSSFGGSGFSRQMGGRYKENILKLQRAIRNPESSSSEKAHIKSRSCPSPFRQFHNRCIHQQTRRHKKLGINGYSLQYFRPSQEFLSISAVHIKGKENVRADFLSRNTLHQADWCLNREIFQMITALWGIPEVDLFATKEN